MSSLSHTHTHTNTYILKYIYFQIINVTVYYEADETIERQIGNYMAPNLAFESLSNHKKFISKFR